MRNMQHYQVTFRPITPILIGTGSEISPLEYRLVKQGQVCQLEVFSINRVFSEANQTDQEVLKSVLKSNDIVALRKKLREMEGQGVKYCSEVSSGFEIEYGRKKDEMNNQLLVHTIQRTGADHKPLIPGSSIKGAIRTALVSEYLLQKGHIVTTDPRNFEGENIGYGRDIRKDPFRALAVTDAPVNGEKVQKLLNVRVKSLKKKVDGVPFYSESLLGYLNGGDSISNHEIRMDYDLMTGRDIIYRGKSENWRVSLKFNLADIFRAANQFYRYHLEQEWAYFYDHPDVDGALKKTIENIRAEVEKSDQEKTCLIRLGRFSQAENVTVDRYRSPRTTKGWGKSRTIADNLWPFGWAFLALEAPFDEEPLLIKKTAEKGDIYPKESVKTESPARKHHGNLNYESQGEDSLRKVKEGDQVDGIVKKLIVHGAFIRIDTTGEELFLHKSEIGSGWVEDVFAHLHEGEKVNGVVFRNPKRNELNFSIKRLRRNR